MIGKAIREWWEDVDRQSPYQWAFHRWIEKAQTRAYELDPRYRAIQNIRDLNTLSDGHHLWIAKDLGLGFEESEYQMKKEREITPKPMHLKVMRWMARGWEQHRPSRYWGRFQIAKQRAKNGYSRYDTWDFSHYIAGVITKALNEWADQPPVGWPGPPMTYEEWVQILRDIAYGFKAGLEAQDIVFDDPVRYKELMTAFDKGFNLFHEHFFYLWD